MYSRLGATEQKPVAGDAPARHVEPKGRRDAFVGMVLDDKYLITRQLGQGGFGSVFEGRDLSLGVSVAIKVLRPDDAWDEGLQTALRDEARHVTRLRHPNVVDWKSFATTADGLCYFVMELLEGEPLESLLEREGAIAPRRAVRILMQVLEALRAAHHGDDDGPILHLDLKPANILLVRHPSGSDEDWVKVIDFGLGQFVGRNPDTVDRGEDSAFGLSDATIRPSTADAATIRGACSREGVIRVMSCTPNYAAPEHGAHLLPDVAPVQLDARCDLYSLGAIAFRMLTGCLPFQGDDCYVELLRAKLVQEPPRLGRIHRGVPRRLAAFVDRCLSRNRDDRWPTTDDALRELRRIATGARWKYTVAATVAIPALAALGARLVASPTAPPFELFARSGGVEVDAARSGLQLGPNRRSVSLRAAGVEVTESAQLRCVLAPTAGAVPIDWLTATWGHGDRVELTAGADDRRRTGTAYLELTTGDAPVRYSRPLSIAFLPLPLGGIAEIEVPGLHDRALDPAGQSLRIRLSLPASDIERVEVVAPAGERAVAAAVANVDAAAEFDLPLEAMSLPPGPCELLVTAVDRALGQTARSFGCRIVVDPLRIDDARIGGGQFGGRTLLGPRSEAMLRLITSGTADLRWTVVHESGRRIGGGEALATRQLQVPLDGIGGDRDFEGFVEVVADDRRFVLRRNAERGTHTLRVPFAYSCSSIELILGAGSPADVQPLREDRPVYVRSERVTLRVTRGNAVPTRVVIATAGTAAERILGEARLDTRTGDSWEQEVLLPPGKHLLEFRAWRMIDGEQVAEPALALRLPLVVDCTAPELAAATRELMVGAAGPQRAVPIQVRDDGSGAVREVRWQVHTAHDRSVLGSGLVADLVPNGDPCALEPHNLPDLPDGDYSVAITAFDLAGNPALPLELPLTVAREGPLLHAIVPDGVTWVADADGMLPIQVRAQDPNRVDRVQCVLGGADGETEVVALAPATDRAAGIGIWQARVRPLAAWDSSDLQIEWTAYDSYGNVTKLGTVQPIGTIDLRVPNGVAVAVAGARLGHMRLVRGNESGPYVFGGRGDEAESRLFRESGLPAFNTLSVERSWQVRCERGAIADYYLDENEVTIGQFLGFVRSDRGWSEPAHWCRGSGPGALRRSQLERLLSSRDLDLPVTDVTWDEAYAFARWSGRRLCTFVEWEYAVRGGLVYRPGSVPGHTPDGAPARVNIAAAGGPPWPVGSGDDRTSDSGVSNLCSNVSEWIQTPDLAGPTDPRAHTDSSDAFLRVLTAEELARHDRFWLVGASFRDVSPTFMVADVLPRTLAAAHVGFRCAASASVVLPQLGRASGDTVTFVGVR